MIGVSYVAISIVAIIFIVSINYVFYYYILQGGVRRGGLTPNRGRRCDTSAAKGYIKNKSRMNEEKENTGIRLNEPATNSAIQHTIKNGSRKQQQQQQHSVCILK